MKTFEKMLNYILVLFGLFSVISSASQNPPATINLINGSGMVYDILHHNGKIYVHTFNEILIYEESSGLLHADSPIEFNLDFGKHNNIFFSERNWASDFSLMTLKTTSTDPELIVIMPDLKIYRISTTDHQIIQTLNAGHEEDIQHFAPLHGNCILKFDNFHDRLYLVLHGRDEDGDNLTGQFHYHDRYLEIFKTDVLGSLQFSFEEFIEREPGNTQNYIDCSISDLEFNYANNYFYLSKLNHIEVWEIVDESVVPAIVVEKDDVFADLSIYEGAQEDFYKFGKMLSIHEGGVHKILALPYRYPSLELVEGKVPLIYVIEGDHSIPFNTDDVTTINAPGEKILDAVYYHNTTDLILSYLPSEALPPFQNTDIAVYDYSGQTFSNNPNQTLSTNTSYQHPKHDINTSFQIIPVLNTPTNDILVGKKDEIIHLSYNGGTWQSQNIWHGESNFFIRGVSGMQSTIFLNAAGCGILKVPNSLQVSQIVNIQTGFPVYHITSNTTGTKRYFYHTLQAENAGLFIQSNEEDPVNINNDPYSTNDIVKAIGDCIYNPYTDHFLVSENGHFGSDPAEIKVIDGESNTFVASILLNDGTFNGQFPKRLFISPEGKLYVMANTRYDMIPQVFVFWAKDGEGHDAYDFIKRYSIEGTNVNLNFNKPFLFYSAHFCYNSNDGYVYLTFHPSEITLDPYLSTRNSMFDFSPGPNESVNTGYILRLNNDETFTVWDESRFPSKMVCPANDNPGFESQYENKMFVIGKDFAEMSNDFSDPVITVDTNEYFNDITYNVYHDKVYVIRDTDDEGVTSDRLVELCEVGYDEGTMDVEFYTVYTFNGQASHLISNPYDSKLYIYHHIDNAKLGDLEANVKVFNPSTNQLETEINLGITNTYPSLDHTVDHHYFYYNITTPSNDPYSNKLYVPNGANSTISVLEFTADEPLLLPESEWAWLSFPRLEVYNGPVLVDNALGSGRIIPIDYEYLDNVSWLEHKDQQNQLRKNIAQAENRWQTDVDLNYIQSVPGYKLKLVYEDPPDKKWIRLFGELLEQSPENISLYKLPETEENWLGYWLYESQHPLDAFRDYVETDKIQSIKGQSWFCARKEIHENPVKSEPNYYWVCSEPAKIDFGEMIIVQAREDIYNFQYNHSGNPPSSEEQAPVEYFSYSEGPEYAGMVIELDSTSNPTEIGVFAGDSCIGASAVSPFDSLCLVRAYMPDTAGAEISFQEYFDSTKSQPLRIREYLVSHPNSGIKEQRIIQSGERQGIYYISFRGQQHDMLPEAGLPLSLECFPNPFSKNCQISYTLNMSSAMMLEVFDPYGRLVDILVDGSIPAGNYSLKWSPLKTRSDKGVYFIRLKTQAGSITRKLVLVN